MRVLLDVSAVPERPVGAGVYTIELARHLVGHIDLTLMSRRNDGQRWEEIAPDATTVPRAPNQRPLRLLWEQRRAARIAQQWHVDCWHGPHYTMPLSLQVPSVVTFHDTTFLTNPEWHEAAKVRYFRAMMRRVAAQATVIVAVSEYTANLVGELLSPKCPVVPIPHGVDFENFSPAPLGNSHDLTLLARSGIRPPFVAFTGTHEPRKDIPGLIAAFARIAHHHPNLTLVLAGPSGWGSNAVNHAVTASGVAERILLPGRLPYATLPALFRQAQVVCYPSFVEGFGLPALETLASGGALLSTSGSAVADIVDDAACVVPPRDVNALTDALDAMLNDPATCARLRERGPNVASAYTWERSAKLHVDAYQLAKERFA
ncbi:MAG: glycosyltransferase family 4 protein [Acidimicrobiia bacterium]